MPRDLAAGVEETRRESVFPLRRPRRRKLVVVGSGARVIQVAPPFSSVSALLVVLCLALSIASGSLADPHLSDHVHSGSSKKRACSADELLPDYEGESDIAQNWDLNTLVTPPFDCTCNTLKASYFCPNLGDSGYPKWVPRPVAEGICSPIAKQDLKHGPFPPGFKILFYGNSHLRQVVEGIVCAYSSAVEHRRLTLFDDSEIAQDVIVGPEHHCRSCTSNPHTMLSVLLDNGCVEGPGSDACRCDDDNSVFEFTNGAMLHYHFAHKEEGKRIEDALRVHGTKFSDYDAVVANLGNEPRMETSEVLRTATALRSKRIPLFWLSAYGGEGDVREWTEREQMIFKHSGAKFIPVHDMFESLRYLTKGVVEGEFNPHFCMPGPPNEIGILLLRIAWAMEEEQGR